MGVDTGESVSLGRGSRVKRPAARYVAEIEEQQPRPRLSSRKRANDPSDTGEQAKRPKSAGTDETDEDDDEEQEYCVCRRGNDGSPMICCSHCDEWFHFKCIGLNKRAADRLDEYICQGCQAKEPGNTKKEDEEYNEGQDDDEDEDDEEEDTHGDDPDAEMEAHFSDASASSERPRTRTVRTKRAPLKTPRRSSSGVDDDPVRRHVLSTFTSIFTPLFTNQGLTADKAASYATELESELFHALGTDPNLRAYKERFRTLHFNLKDPRNVTLHERITSGQLPAEEVVHMSNEALANDAIREATEKAKRDALQQAVLLREKEGPARKITHKGEVDIERDDPAFASKEIRSLPATEPQPISDSAADASAMPSSSPSMLAKNHDDMPSFTEPDSLTGLWDKQAAPIPEEAPMDEPTDLGIAAPTEADSFVDSFLGDEHPSSSAPSAGHKVQENSMVNAAPDTLESHTPAGTPPPDSFAARWAARSKNTLTGSPVIWDGVITMPEYTSAYVHVRPLSHPWYAPEAPLWRDCFPTPERTVEGRLPSQTAIDYLAQVRMSPRNEIVVLALDAGGASAASGRHEGTLHSSPALDKLVHYFADKQRFGVLAPAPGMQGSLVKDFYLAPLLSHEPVPDWLTMLSPEGLGDAWAMERPAHVLLVILVLFKAAMEGKTTAPPSAAADEDGSVPPTAPVAPVSLDTLLNVKPDAIQNLLSTLNGSGGASPLQAMSTPPPLATPPPGPGPLGPPGSNVPPGPPPMLPMHGLPPHGLGPPGPPPPVPVARPMRPWGGAHTVAQPPPSFPPPMTSVGPPPPFPVGPGGWYGGNAERSNDRSLRKGGGARRSGRR